jgi:GntR family transcriptional regulator/MocR family aminotransferase
MPNRPPNWDARLQSRPSRNRHVTKPPDWFNYPFPFVYGQPDQRLFPLEGWREAVKLSQRASTIRNRA